MLLSFGLEAVESALAAQRLLQITILAMLKWHPTHVATTHASFGFGLCSWLRLPGGLETDL